jgi:hypothetical protein
MSEQWFGEKKRCELALLFNVMMIESKFNLENIEKGGN